VEYSHKQDSERRIYWFFRIGVFLKGAVSLIETISGILVLTIPTFLIGTVVSMSRDELLEEPGDFIATHSLQLAQQFSVSATAIIGLYLLTRGIIKLGLVIALWKNQLWAYPASLVVMGLFIVYQIYEIIVGHSMLIVIITILDLIVVYLIWIEYTIVRRRMHHIQS
jgi:uncharacterized membrane protein